MPKFINKVLNDLNSNLIDISDCVFVLPNKRSGFILINEISKHINQTIFAPKTITIEEFVTEISDLKLIKNAELLFELYEIYCQENLNNPDIEDLDGFYKWGQLLIQDFNEIDRFLVHPDHIFDYLFSIKEINHWSLNNQDSILIKNHLKFWKQLKVIYQKFSDELLKNKKAYQGLIYREALSNLETYIQFHKNKKFIFLGFNALSKSESLIIQDLLEKQIGLIYWDVDTYFINHSNHSAGQFINSYYKDWTYYENHPLLLKTSQYLDSKNINVISVPGMVGQAKSIGNILKKISHKDLSKTAVILGEEQLLEPLLESLPTSIDKVNITMGLPLKHTTLASLFHLWFQTQIKSSDKIYYKDVIKLMTHPYIKEFLNFKGIDGSLKIRNYIQNNNLTYVSLETLYDIDTDLKDRIKLLFESWNQNPKFALHQILNLIFTMKMDLKQKSNNILLSEYLYRFSTLFNELQRLNEKYKKINDINTLSQIFNQLLNTETLNFSGEPIQGLQIMGVLESRVLDFETVIISSLNEGILPSGKTDHSFIPYDVKIENNLPTYKDKDAIYSYHFFRLLQRAKNIYLIYNTEVDALRGGEKSRFIRQLEIEKIHQINHYHATPQIDKSTTKLKKINKTNKIYKSIKELASHGFSPSSLNNYIRNPLDFYYQSVLKIKDIEGVEESLESKSFGNIVHNTLEHLYKPLIGKNLKIDDLKKLFSKIEKLVINEFLNIYKTDSFKQGKNKIIYEVSKQYVKNFIELEIDLLKKGHEIKILALEEDCKCQIPIKNLDFPVMLKGKIDRIDLFDSKLRIIDYKTGKVKLNDVEIINWEDITTDYDKFNKSFQLLIYVYMLSKNNKIDFPVEAGIYSFKNLNSGFLKFSKKNRSGVGAKKDSLISQEFLNIFEKELQKLILEICNLNIDFIQKEIKQATF